MHQKAVFDKPQYLPVHPLATVPGNGKQWASDSRAWDSWPIASILDESLSLPRDGRLYVGLDNAEFAHLLIGAILPLGQVCGTAGDSWVQFPSL